jgi:hypothetical protein
MRRSVLNHRRNALSKGRKFSARSSLKWLRRERAAQDFFRQPTLVTSPLMPNCSLLSAAKQKEEKSLLIIILKKNQ